MEEDQKKEKENVMAAAEAALVVQPIPITDCKALVIVPPLPVPPPIPDVLEEMPLALVPAKKPRNPNSYKHLTQRSRAQGKETKKRILEVLTKWADDRKYPGATGGFIDIMAEVLTCQGYPITAGTVMDHVLELAKKKDMYCERMVYDPRRTYKRKANTLPKGYFYEYYIALNGDKGERGVVEYVYYASPESQHNERDEKGHFKKRDT